MRSTAFVLAIAIILGLAGCGAPKTDTATTTTGTTTGSTSTNESTPSTTDKSTSGATSSTDNTGETATTPTPGDPSKGMTTTVPGAAPPGDKPADTTAPVATDTPKADDMNAVKPLLYPGSKPSGANEGVFASNKDDSLVVTRTTSDGLDKVKAFYKDKEKWSSTTLDVDGLAIYESKTGNIRTIVGATSDNGTTTITVTRMTEKS